MRTSKLISSELKSVQREERRLTRTQGRAEAQRLRSRRILVWSAVGFFLMAGIWASQSELEEVVRGNGQVIPDTSTQIVQSLEGGIISEIRVSEGARVQKDDVLLKLNDAQFAAAYDQEMATRRVLRARIVRLLAEARGEDDLIFPADLEADDPHLIQGERELFALRKNDQAVRTRAASDQMKNVEKQLGLILPAVKSGSISEAEKLRLEGEILKLNGEIDTLESGFVRDAMERYDQEAANLASLEESLRAHKDRLERATLKSPIDGIVNAIFVDTVERVVAGGDAIMEIVPLEGALVIEAKLRPQDIAFIYQGQRSNVRFSAYDPTIYGGLEGVVDTIGVDTISSEEGDIFYPIKIRTKSSSLGRDSRTGKPLQLVPGMVAEVDIITGSKSLFDYLLKPVRRAKFRALRER